jgi:hypothetical protein
VKRAFDVVRNSTARGAEARVKAYLYLPATGPLGERVQKKESPEKPEARLLLLIDKTTKPVWVGIFTRSYANEATDRCHS